MQKPSLKLSAFEIINKIEIQYIDYGFTNGYQIKPINICLSGNEYIPMYYNNTDFLGITFIISGDLLFVYFGASNITVGLSKGDEILIYFDGGDIIQYKFSGSGVRGITHNINMVIPSQSDMDLFMSSKITYWSFTKKNGLKIEGDNNIFPEVSRIKSRNDFNLIVNHVASTMQNELIRIISRKNKGMIED